MTFHRAEPDQHYRNLRLISAEGRWVLGLALYASGLRLRMGRIGLPPSVLDFCLGTEPSIYAPVLQAVLLRLEPLAENITPDEIDDVFPWAGTRPDLALHLEPLLASNISDPAGAAPARS